MKASSLIFIVIFMFSACATLPVSTKTLTKEVITEANDMHKLNIYLVNTLFEERMQRVDTFIKNKYMPKLISEYQQLLPDTLDYKKELPNIITSIIPIINQKKDSLERVLKNQRLQITNQLNTNFILYSKATISLQGIINSAIKLKVEDVNALNSIEKITGTTSLVEDIKSKEATFLNKTEKYLDTFLKK